MYPSPHSGPSEPRGWDFSERFSELSRSLVSPLPEPSESYRVFSWALSRQLGKAALSRAAAQAVHDKILGAPHTRTTPR